MKQWRIMAWLSEQRTINFYRRRIRKFEQDHARIQAEVLTRPWPECDHWEKAAYRELQECIDRIECAKTERLMRCVADCGLSMPPPSDESDYWMRSRTLECWLLTLEGQDFARRRIAMTASSDQSPGLSWIVICVGVGSLAFVCLA